MSEHVGAWLFVMVCIPPSLKAGASLTLIVMMRRIILMASSMRMG